MAKPKRKQRPSMPYWVWYMEYCVFCKNKNCGNCKAAKWHRDDARRKRDRKEKVKIRQYEEE